MGGRGSKPAAPQLRYGRPFDLSADVPILPPLAAALTCLVALIAWRLTRKPLNFLPAPLNALAVRIAVLVAVLAAIPSVIKTAGGELDAAGSGTWFVPVKGLATAGVYSVSRNPMYAALLFIVVPGFGVVIDSLWPMLLDMLFFSYIHFVVVGAEEALLSKEFGAQYEAFKQAVPRYALL